MSEIRDDDSIAVEPVVDRDTQAVPGSPDIGVTILEKIDASEAIVADVTIVGAYDSERPTPNPNVLIELGYALKSLGERRLILVQNVAFGGPELLPFDLRQKRVLTYESPTEAESRAEARRALQRELREALTLILNEAESSPGGEDPVELALTYTEKRIESERHDYQLQISLTNVGTTTIEEWHVDVEIPTRLPEPGVTRTARVPERSDQNQTLMRATRLTHRGDIYPGDTRLAMTIDYRVDREIFENRQGLFEQPVTAKAYVHGELGATTAELVRNLQNF